MSKSHHDAAAKVVNGRIKRNVLEVGKKMQKQTNDIHLTDALKV
jgi:hypothetical protein